MAIVQASLRDIGNTILVKTNSESDRRPVREGIVASGQTIYPGQIIRRTGANQWTLSALTQLQGGVAVAVENEFDDDATHKAVDVPYTAGETIYYVILQPGDEAYIFVADGQAIADSEAMKPTTGGLLTQGTTTGATVTENVFTALEALSPSGTDDRIKALYLCGVA